MGYIERGKERGLELPRGKAMSVSRKHKRCKAFRHSWTCRPPTLVVLAATLLGIAVSAWACETPVYRYAMYRWTPMPYEAYYFHRGQVPKADQEVHRLLTEASKEGVAANVLVTPVDLDRKDALETLPEPVKKLWQAQNGKPLPRYVVLTPWGDELFTGQIDQAAAGELMASPTRTEIGKLFDQGHGIVLLILEGDKPEENQRMEAEARKVMAVAAAGKLFAEFGEDMDPPPTQDTPGNAAPKTDSKSVAKPEAPAVAAEIPSDSEPGGARGVLRVALLKLQRSNAAERWLLKSLMAMTPDPQKQKPPHEPMLFAIYGRGRVMPPGIGKEVTVETLSGLLRFLGDRCSCTIKDQNPGLDLLMRWDWEGTAEKFAAEEEANSRPPLYAEMPADGQASPPAKGDDGPPTAQPASATGTPTVPASPPPAAAVTQAAMAPSTPAPAAAASQAPANEVSQQDPPSDGFAARQRWQLGLGLAGVALVVMAVGFMLIRRQQHASS